MANKFTTQVHTVYTVAGTDKVQKGQKAIKETGTAAKKAAGDFRSLAGAFTGLIVAKRMAGGLKAVIEPSIKVEAALEQIRIIAGVTGDAYQKMAAKAVEGAEKTIFSQVEAANAMLTLQRATGDTDFTLKALVQTLALAQAFPDFKVKDAAGFMAQLRVSFGLTSEQAIEASDQITRGAIKAGRGVEIFRLAMGKLAVAQKLGNQSFHDTIASFLLFDKVFRNPRRSSQGIEKLFAELKGEKANNAFSALFGKSIHNNVTNTTMSMRQFFDEMLRVSETAEGMAALQAAISDGFDNQAVRPIISILNNLRKEGGIAGFDSLVSTMVGGTGSASAMAEERLMTLEGRLLLLDQAGENLRKSIGDLLGPAILDLAKNLKVVADWLRKIVEMPLVPPLVSWAVKVGLLGVAWFTLRAAVMGVTKILTVTISNMIEAGSIMNMLRTSISAVTASYRGLTAAATQAGAATRASGAGNIGSMLSGGAGAGGAAAGGLRGRLAGGIKGLAGPAALLAIAMNYEKVIPGLQQLGRMLGSVGRGDDGTALANKEFNNYLSASMKGVKDADRLSKLRKMRDNTSVMSSVGDWLGLDTWAGRLDKMVEEEEKRVKKDWNVKAKIAKEEMAMSKIFQIGSKGFNEAVSRMQKLLAPRPQVIKTSAIKLLETELAAIAGAKVGSIHRGKVVTRGDVTGATEGMHAVRTFIELAGRQARKGDVTGHMQMVANQGVTAALMSLEGSAFDPTSQARQKAIREGFIDPLGATQTPAQQTRAGLASMIRGDRPKDTTFQSNFPTLDSSNPTEMQTDFSNANQTLASPALQMIMQKQQQTLDEQLRCLRKLVGGVKVKSDDPRNSGNVPPWMTMPTSGG